MIWILYFVGNILVQFRWLGDILQYRLFFQTIDKILLPEIGGCHTRKKICNLTKCNRFGKNEIYLQSISFFFFKLTDVQNLFQDNKATDFIFTEC